MVAAYGSENQQEHYADQYCQDYDVGVCSVYTGM